MGENYLDMVPVIVIFFALGILLSRLGGIACPYREISCKKRTIKRVKPLKIMERSRTLWYNIIIGTAVE